MVEINVILLTFTNNFPHSFKATIVEANITLIKSNTKNIVEENI